MRLLVAVLLSVLLAETAAAQVVYVVFRDRDIEKRYKKHLTKVNGMDALVGEPKAGVTILANGTINYINGPDASNELWVADSSFPDKPPYEIDRKSGKKVASKKGKGDVVAFSGYEVQGIKYVDPLRTLEGYAEEYLQRMGEVEAMEKTLKDLKKGTKDWFVEHGRIVGRYVQLQTWLGNAGYDGAAEKLQKVVDKQRKVVAKESAAVREAEAMKSIHRVDTPADLTRVAADVAGGAEFHVQESRHMRVTYLADISDEQVAGALELVERIVEGFRREHVDPYVGDDFPDTIPDQGPLVEFYFGPADLGAHERFLTDYYGLKWGRDKTQEMQASGALYYRAEAPFYLHYRKLLDDIDLEGYLAHGMGWALADLHYNQGRRNDAQPWIMEAAGYEAALAYLGRNNITTFSEGVAEYAQQVRESGFKTAKTGLRGFYNEIAREKGPKIDAIGPKALYQLTDEDYCKAWSFLDFVVRTRGKEGQVWLRGTCDAAADRATFMVTWRAVTEALKPVESSVDVFTELEKDWKRYAERDQVAAGD